MPIQVITHNGKPPAEGGLRLGYLVGDLFFAWGGSDCMTRAQACAMFVSPQFAPKKPIIQKKTVPTIIFSKLPIALDTSYRCPECYSRDNPAVMTSTDEGIQRVGMCERCDTLFQAWQSTLERMKYLRTRSVGVPSHPPVPPESGTEKMWRTIISNVTVLPQKSARKKTAKPEKPLIKFETLPRTLNYNQACFGCEHEPNHLKNNVITDQGPKRLIICAKCGEIMRPFKKD